MTNYDLHELKERAKELRCMYQVHAIVSERGQSPASTFLEVLKAIPQGWQHPESTCARIDYLGRHYVGPGFSSTGNTIAEPIRLHGFEVGQIEVSNTANDGEKSPKFLTEEIDLLRNIAHRLGDYLEWRHTELLGEIVPTTVHWRWRDLYVTALAKVLDGQRFGVCGVYLGGSTENGDAGPGSDIDLYIHFDGNNGQRRDLESWLDGWSLCLGELAYQHTGYEFPEGILNVQWLDTAPDVRSQPGLRQLKIQGQEQ